MLHRKLVLGIVLLAAGALRADISPDPLGGGITPGPYGETTEVAMASEEVELTLSKERLHVKATFYMENLGGNTALEVGFPMESSQELQDFAVEIDGKKAIPSIKEVDSTPGPLGRDFRIWLVWDMSFAAGAKKTVVVTYHVETMERHFNLRGPGGFMLEEVVGSEEVLDSLARRRTRYILETGAPWKGSIGKAVVRLKMEGGLTAANLRELSPPPTSRTDAGAEWILTDLEPTENIEISFCPGMTLDREIEFARGIKGEGVEVQDQVSFQRHVADLLKLKGDRPGMRAACEAMLDLIIAEQGAEFSREKPGLDEIHEIATNLFGSPEAVSDAGTEARAKKACDFLDRWMAFDRYEESVIAALVLARKALGRDFRDLVKVLDIESPEGKSMEFPDVGDAGKAILEEERVTITVGAKETVYETTYVLRGKRDGSVKATVGGPLEPMQAELVAAAEGTFDNVFVAVDGVRIKVEPLVCTVHDGDDETEHETRTGWMLPVHAGKPLEVRVRITMENWGDISGYIWKPSLKTPPDDERRFDRQRATWTAAGSCWKSPRKLSVAIRLPDGVSASHVRHLFPDTGKLDGNTARWTFDAVDTSPIYAETEVHIQWKGFTLEEEITHLGKLLESNPPSPEIVRFQLALALRHAGRFKEEVAELETVIAGKIDPIPSFGDNGRLIPDPGAPAQRPLACYVFEARRKLDDAAATKVAAERAVEALKARLINVFGPESAKIPLWRELAETHRYLGHDKEAAEADERAKELDPERR